MQPWPEDALELVANKFLDDVEMSQDVREETVVMCKHFHESVRKLSEKYVQVSKFISFVYTTLSLGTINRTHEFRNNLKKLAIFTKVCVV